MDTNIRRRKRATTFRTAGWLAVVALVGLSFAAPVFASTATINGTDRGATVTVTGWRQVWAGDFNGTIDGNAVKFYCIDTGHTISIPSVDPYTNDGPTSAQITYILNNYFPYASGSGQLTDLDKEAAAVQLVAIWHFSDGINLSNISNTRMSGVEIALTTNSGTLSTSSVTTTGGVETPVTLTQDSSRRHRHCEDDASHPGRDDLCRCDTSDDAPEACHCNTDKRHVDHYG